MSSSPRRIPLARPSIGDGERAAADRALTSGRLVLGPENRRFEQALAELTGRRHAIATASGTTALELSLWALGVRAGQRVLVTAFGFVAAANAVARLGATPVPVDVDAATWNVDPDAARSLADGAVGLISIDQLGTVATAAPLEALCTERGMWLLDDAACGLGATDSAGVPGGGYGRAATLSFHPRKVVTTGEGGAILTDDDTLAEKLRQMRNHGQRGRGDFARVGTNARLSEPAAAIGSAQLARLPAMLAERRLLARGYLDRLAPLIEAGTIAPQQPVDAAMHAYQTFALRLAEGIRRDDVISALDARDIEAGPATYAFHRLASFAGAAAGPLPVADALHDRGLALPLFCGMRSGELDRVAEALAEVLT